MLSGGKHGAPRDSSTLWLPCHVATKLSLLGNICSHGALRISFAQDRSSGTAGVGSVAPSGHHEGPCRVCILFTTKLNS